jgi:uncharacterized protein involved in oxidation of intracellular sulfur
MNLPGPIGQGAMMKKVAVGVCGTCMDARGLRDEEMVDGAARETLEELAEWTQWSDRVLVF